MSVTIWSFIGILLLITASGAMSVIHKRRTTKDYLVASRQVPPWLSALSTVATNNSGFMFIGMIAYTYRLGIESVWMMVGWVFGDMLMWVFVHPRVRRASSREETRSLPGMVGTRGDVVMRPVVVLAGLFAATISTADSQIIVCSGAMTQDVRPRWQDSYLASKLATFLVTSIALGIALFAPEGVFGLVLIAWSALGASLTPVLVIQLFRLPLGTATALAMMIAAVVTVSLWHVSPWNDDVFKALPGVAAAVAVYLGARLGARLRGR